MRRRPRTVPAFRGRRLGWMAGICAGIFLVLMAGVYGLWPLDPLDRAVEAFAGDFRHGAYHRWLIVITALGDGLFLTLVAVVTIASFLFTGARWRAFFYALIFSALPIAVSLIKVFVARARPTDLPYTGIDVFSFPSSHVANSALIYGAIAGLTFVTFHGWFQRLMTGAFLLLPLMIGVSRVYLGAHWFSDVIAGYAVAGLFLVLLAILVARHPEPPRFVRGIPIALFLMAAAFPAYLLYAMPDAAELYRAVELHEKPAAAPSP